MSKNITNTLSRWHKVSERLKEAHTEARSAILQALNAGQSIDVDEFVVRSDALSRLAKKSITEDVEKVSLLLEALFHVRRELARANVAFKVTDLLNDLEHAKQNLKFWEEAQAATKDRMSLAELDSLAQRRASQPPSSTHILSRDRYSVNLLGDDLPQSLVSKRDEARKAVNAISDKLSEANASKLTISLNEDVVRILGLE